MWIVDFLSERKGAMECDKERKQLGRGGIPYQHRSEN